MKLIKLSEEHYVIVDESEIKPCQPANICMAHKTKVCDKCCRYLGMVVVKKPDLSEVEEAIYGYSVDNILDKLLIDRGEHSDRVRNAVYFEERELAKNLLSSYKELVKDKLFTAEDMKRELLSIATEIATEDGELSNCSPASMFKWVENKVKSLMPPKTEWEVEFDEQCKLKLA